jgi:hypothetical protein
LTALQECKVRGIRNSLNYVQMLDKNWMLCYNVAVGKQAGGNKGGCESKLVC